MPIRMRRRTGAGTATGGAGGTADLPTERDDVDRAADRDSAGRDSADRDSADGDDAERNGTDRAGTDRGGTDHDGAVSATAGRDTAAPGDGVAPPGSRPAPDARLRRRVVALAVAVLVSVALTGYGWYARSATATRATQTRTCLSDATTAARAIFSYDYRNFDASLAAARSHVTGRFATEYAGTTGTLRATAITQQAVVQAQVSAVGVVERRGGSITVLVFLNQYRRNSAITGEKVDQSRVVLTMVRSGGHWKVSAATAL